VADLALDPATGDLQLSGGQLLLATDDEAIRQDWRLRLALGLGEWFLDQRLGVPYQQLLQKHDERRLRLLLRTIFSRVTIETAGIASVRSITMALDRQTRTLTLDIVAVKDDGDPIELDYRDTVIGEVPSA